MSTPDTHEDPQNEYERMLDRNGLDCHMYACWQPIRAIVTTSRGEFRYCERHAKTFGQFHNTQWLES